jgi:hypothetical protein
MPKAVAAGVDGLILLTAGAGGQTGWANGFSFVRAVRAFFDGPVVLAGGISDGAAILAAQVLGADLAYMGTKFIATRESMAEPAYKQMLVESRLDDILLSKAFTGLETNTLRPSIVASGLDQPICPRHGPQRPGALRQRWQHGRQALGRHLGAGHSVSGWTPCKAWPTWWPRRAANTACRRGGACAGDRRAGACADRLSRRCTGTGTGTGTPDAGVISATSTISTNGICARWLARHCRQAGRLEVAVGLCLLGQEKLRSSGHRCLRPACRRHGLDAAPAPIRRRG